MRFFASFTVLHVGLVLVLLAVAAVNARMLWRRHGRRFVLHRLRLALAIAIVGQLPLIWNSKTPFAWNFFLFVTLCFWALAFFILLSGAASTDMVIRAMAPFFTPRPKRRYPPKSFVLPDKKRGPEPPFQPASPDLSEDSPFFVREGCYGAAGDVYYQYTQGETTIYFYMFPDPAWGDYKPAHAHRVRIPSEFRAEPATGELIRWRLLVIRRVLSFVESDGRLHELPGGVDFRDLTSFDGVRPDTLHW